MVEENRFRSIYPTAVPWRERRMVDATACALVAAGATDAEAAAIFAAENADLRAHLQRLLAELDVRPHRFTVPAAKPTPKAPVSPPPPHEGW